MAHLVSLTLPYNNAVILFPAGIQKRVDKAWIPAPRFRGDDKYETLHSLDGHARAGMFLKRMDGNNKAATMSGRLIYTKSRSSYSATGGFGGALGASFAGTTPVVVVVVVVVSVPGFTVPTAVAVVAPEPPPSSVVTTSDVAAGAPDGWS